MTLIFTKLIVTIFTLIVFISTTGSFFKNRYKDNKLIISLSVLIAIISTFTTVHFVIDIAKAEIIEEQDDLSKKREDIAKNAAKKEKEELAKDTAKKELDKNKSSNEEILTDTDPVEPKIKSWRYEKLIKVNNNLWEFGKCKIPASFIYNPSAEVSNDKSFAFIDGQLDAGVSDGFKTSTLVLSTDTCKITKLKGKGIADRSNHSYISKDSKYLFVGNQHRNIGVYSKKENWKLIKILGKWTGSTTQQYLMKQSPDNRYLAYTFMDSWGIYDIKNNVIIKKYNDRTNEPPAPDKYNWGRDLKIIKFLSNSPEILLEVEIGTNSSNTKIKRYIYNYQNKTYTQTTDFSN